MSELVICTKVEKVGNGYIVQVRWPYGPEVMGYGRVICTTWQQVVDLLTQANLFEGTESTEGTWKHK